MALKFSIQIFSATRQRRRFPRRQLVRAEWNEIRYGGFADFTVDTSAAFSDLASIVATDLVEIYIDDVFRFRGEIMARHRREGEPDTLTFTGYGRMQRVGAHVAVKNYIYPTGTDISLALRDVITDWVLPEETAPLAVQATSTGTTVLQVSAYIKLTKDVFNDITQYSANQANWGVDVDTDPASATYLQDRFYVEPVSQGTDWVISPRTKRIGNLDSEEQADKVVNALYIVGGTPLYPNLLYNGGFSRPVFAGDAGVGNLLNSPGFEDRHNWSLHSGTDYKASGLSEGAAYEGGDMVQADSIGEGFNQTRNNLAAIIPGDDYEFGGHFRREHGNNVGAGTITINWNDASGHVISSSVMPDSYLAPTDAIWRYYYMTDRAPAGAAGFDFNFTLTQNDGSTDQGNGLMCDMMNFVDVSIGRQDRWSLYPFGSAQVLSQNWLYPDYYLGGYSVFISQSSSDMDGQDMHLSLADGDQFDVQNNEEITFMAAMKLPPGQATNAKMLLEVHFFKQDGSEHGPPVKYTIPAGAMAPGGWYLVSNNVICASDAVKASAYVTFRGTGAIIIDSLCVRDTAALNPAFLQDFLIPDGPLQYRTTAAEMYAFSVDHQDIALSATNYGTKYQIVNEDTLTTVEDAKSYATAFFLANALPPLSPSLQLIDDARIFRCGQGIQLTGTEGKIISPKPIPLVRIEHTYDGQLSTTLMLEREQRDQGAIILDQIQREAAKQTNTSPFTSTSQGSSAGGVGTVSANYWGSSPRTSSDPSLHDAYLPIAGPHIVPAERSQFNATSGEVVAARTRTALGTSSLTLEDRLDAMETDIAGGAVSTAQAAAYWRGRAYLTTSSGHHEIDSSYFDGGSNFPSGATQRTIKVPAGIDGSLRWQTTLPYVIWLRIGVTNTAATPQAATWWVPYVDNAFQIVWNGTTVFQKQTDDGSLIDNAGTFTIDASQSAVLELLTYNETGGTFDSGDNPGTFDCFLSLLDLPGIQFYDPGA